jgi:hypothetical protein
MLVMNIRVVGMLVAYRFMAMPMHMRLVNVHVDIVLMLMVFIVRVRMRVLKRLMDVLVFMGLGQVQPHAQAHECAGNPERCSSGLTEQQQGNRRPDERGSREIGACPGRPQTAQGHHKKYQADAIAQ